MADVTRVEVTHEYDTLRHELLEAKRYVFERPLAIAALAAVGLQVFDKPQHIALPPAISLLTLFNFWFTVNRLQSAARIVAYIQLVLEPSARLRWIGWETSLRQYRMWLRAKTNAKEYIDKHLDPTAVPDALMYYPPVYYFHGGLMAFSAIAGLLQFAQEKALWAQALSLAAVGLGLWSLVYFWRYRPQRVRSSIEINRVIWQAVLEYCEPAAGDRT